MSAESWQEIIGKELTRVGSFLDFNLLDDPLVVAERIQIQNQFEVGQILNYVITLSNSVESDINIAVRTRFRTFTGLPSESYKLDKRGDLFAVSDKLQPIFAIGLGNFCKQPLSGDFLFVRRFANKEPAESLGYVSMQCTNSSEFAQALMNFLLIPDSKLNETCGREFIYKRFVSVFSGPAEPVPIDSTVF